MAAIGRSPGGESMTGNCRLGIGGCPLARGRRRLRGVHRLGSNISDLKLLPRTVVRHGFGYKRLFSVVPKPSATSRLKRANPQQVLSFLFFLIIYISRAWDMFACFSGKFVFAIYATFRCQTHCNSDQQHAALYICHVAVCCLVWRVQFHAHAC